MVQLMGAPNTASKLAVVVIGRNEGERLARCIASVRSPGSLIVYVDSGSIDGSTQLARQAGSAAVELDSSQPFSAARARNVGFRQALQLRPDIRYIQFVDGDCEIAAGWLDRAVEALEDRPDVAAVCGLLNEKYPERSIYNRLCDMEWKSDIGEIPACGGIAMFRASAFQAVGGFNPRVTAGEEPELCLRLRENRWRIVRLPCDMARHDADIRCFSQWFKRAVRGGYAAALGFDLHGREPGRYRLSQIRSAFAWAIGLPLSIVSAMMLAVWCPSAWWLPIGLVCGYPLLLFRICGRRLRQGDPPSHATAYALFCVLSKWAECVGIARYARDRLNGTQPSLIEYKAIPGGNGNVPADLRAKSGLLR